MAGEREVASKELLAQLSRRGRVHFSFLRDFVFLFFYSSPDNPTEMPTHDRRGIIEKQWAASSVVPFPTRAPFQRRLRKCV